MEVSDVTEQVDTDVLMETGQSSCEDHEIYHTPKLWSNLSSEQEELEHNLASCKEIELLHQVTPTAGSTSRKRIPNLYNPLKAACDLLLIMSVYIVTHFS